MEWLTLWLKKIILLVLLAAFLDLILPNSSLQRYVKMVMGLIILLTILSPVFTLFNLSQEELALRLDRYQEQWNKPADEEWKRMASRLLGHRDQQVQEYVEKQVESAVRSHVQETFGVELRSVEVKIDSGNPDHPVIRQVELVLEDEPRANGAPLQPVEPIGITRQERSPGTGEQAEIPAAARPESPLYRQIAESVAREWSIPPEQVFVTDDFQRAVKQ
jgi:stage III sporulation protein AF